MKRFSRLPLTVMAIAAAAWCGSCTTGTEPKKKPKPPPPPPPGSELSTQPWARPEKDWEGGRPAFMPSTN